MTSHSNKNIDYRSEIDRYKREINLVAFVLDKGYLLHKESLNKNPFRTTIKVYKGARDEQETLLIFRNDASGHFLYSNVDDRSDKGTIIDFCQNKLGLNINEARKELKNYFGLPEPVQQATQYTRTPKGDFSYIKEINKPFLSFRKIDPSTYQSDLFLGTFGTKVIKDAIGNSYNNTAFPIYDKSKKVVGLELKNNAYTSSFKGAYLDSNKAEGMWISNIRDSHKGNCIFGLVESPIDAFSHYELNRENDRDRYIYFSTNGSLNSGHIPLIQHFVDQYSPDSVRLLFDRDHAGLRYSCMVAANLSPAGTSSEFEFQIDFKKKDKINAIQIHAKNPTVEKDLISVFRNSGIQLIESAPNTLSGSIDNQFDSLLELTKFLCRMNGNFCSHKMSVDKDYNKDLVKIKNERGLSRNQ